MTIAEISSWLAVVVALGGLTGTYRLCERCGQHLAERPWSKSRARSGRWLQWAIRVTVAVNFWAALHYLLAAGQLPQDIQGGTGNFILRSSSP